MRPLPAVGIAGRDAELVRAKSGLTDEMIFAPGLSLLRERVPPRRGFEIGKRGEPFQPEDFGFEFNDQLLHESVPGAAAKNCASARVEAAGRAAAP
jgi:hypothetical protein